jgi:preprotein translocase subunit SecG
MFIALVVLHTFVCLAIIGIVLLQSGKGADIGSAFGGAGSQAVFGSMGTPTVLGKFTAVVAVLFLVTSFGLALLGGSDRGSSVIREVPVPPSSSAPSGPTPGAPAAPPAANPAPSSTPTK